MSRELLKIYRANKENALTKRDYIAKNMTEQSYVLFGGRERKDG